MAYTEVLSYFIANIPVTYPDHMFCYFASNAALGKVRPFLHALVHALDRIDKASPGYAHEMIDRMASIKGKGESQYEMLIQICSEIYVTGGAVETGDRSDEGRELFRHEPTVHGGKNPEFEVRSGGIWYAVEVKTPKLIDYGRIRQASPLQLTARLPKEYWKDEKKTLPRDNPVKDFLVSANEKFAEYSLLRPEAYRILTIVWDDFCNEPISALLHPYSGLLTEKSFYVDEAGKSIRFTHLDAVLICRYQHQLIRATREEPLVDSETAPFMYYNQGFPPKALIENPAGKAIPDELLEPLNATRWSGILGGEYNPCDFVMWVGGEDEDDEEATGGQRITDQ